MGVGVGADDVHDLEGYPKLKRKMMTSMDLIVADYKTNDCQTSLGQFTMMVDETMVKNLPYQINGGEGGAEPYVIIVALILSVVVIMLVGMLGWVFYAYRNPTARSGQILIRSTAKNRLFR